MYGKDNTFSGHSNGVVREDFVLRIPVISAVPGKHEGRLRHVVERASLKPCLEN